MNHIYYKTNLRKRSTLKDKVLIGNLLNVFKGSFCVGIVVFYLYEFLPKNIRLVNQIKCSI